MSDVRYVVDLVCTAAHETSTSLIVPSKNMSSVGTYMSPAILQLQIL